MFDIITSRELISRLTRTVRRPVRYCHQRPVRLLPSRNSTVSTIGTNVEPPEIRRGGAAMLVPVSCDLWLGNHLSRAHFHSASRMASRSQQWPIIPHTVDEKLPAVIFDQPDPRALWIYEHRQGACLREDVFQFDRLKVNLRSQNQVRDEN
jgi:hypothetical protein